MLNTSGQITGPVDLVQLQEYVLGLASQVQAHGKAIQEWEALKEKIFTLEKEKEVLNTENEFLKKKIRDLELNSISNSTGASQVNSTSSVSTPSVSVHAPHTGGKFILGI